MVATPIGNLADLSPRALRILSEVDVIACEDTRHTQGLLRQNNISKRLVSLHEHNEYEACEALLVEIQSLGQSLAYVSDAGTPGVSDPGSHLVAAAHRLGVAVVAIPGPSALATALSVCGFTREHTFFVGFLPRKETERDSLLEKVKAIAPCNFVFFESPNRIVAAMRYLLTRLDGETEVCVCRELTKIYETIFVCQLSLVEERLKEYPERGEYVIVVAMGASKKEKNGGSSLQVLAREALGQFSSGRNLKDAARVLARKHNGFSSREIYQEALKLSSLETKNAADPGLPQIAQLSRQMFSENGALGRAVTVLSGWFERSLTRSAALEIDASQPDASTMFWCALLYKRGFQKLSWNGVDAGSLQRFSAEALVPEMTLCEPGSLFRRVEADLVSGHALCILDSGFVENWPDWKDLVSRNASFCIQYHPEESTKRIETLLAWSKQITSEVFLIWSVGGGITSDMGGMLAGLFGLAHNCSPTTLLSACDAAVGGKTAVNFPPFGKNQLGLFYPTSSLVASAEHFLTLSRTAIVCGLSETIKQLWLVGGFEESAAQSVKEILASLTSCEPDRRISRFPLDSLERAAVTRYADLVQFNYQVKAAFVRADPLESGLRKALNFGHTLAHVIEGLGDAGYLKSFDHGVAVAIGMLFVLRTQESSDRSASAVRLILELLEVAAVELPLKPIAAVGSSKDKVAFKDAFAKLILSDKKMDRKSAASIPFVIPSYGYFAGIVDHSIDSSVQSLSIEPCMSYLSIEEVFRLCSVAGIIEF